MANSKSLSFYCFVYFENKIASFVQNKAMIGVRKINIYLLYLLNKDRPLDLNLLCSLYFT